MPYLQRQRLLYMPKVEIATRQVHATRLLQIGSIEFFFRPANLSEYKSGGNVWLHYQIYVYTGDI
jgi:hypothetical protein